MPRESAARGYIVGTRSSAIRHACPPLAPSATVRRGKGGQTTHRPYVIFILADALGYGYLSNTAARGVVIACSVVPEVMIALYAYIS